MEGLESFALDAGMMHEDVLACVLSNEAKALFIIEPLDLATRHNLLLPHGSSGGAGPAEFESAHGITLLKWHDSPKRFLRPTLGWGQGLSSVVYDLKTVRNGSHRNRAAITFARPSRCRDLS